MMKSAIILALTCVSVIINVQGPKSDSSQTTISTAKTNGRQLERMRSNSNRSDEGRSSKWSEIRSKSDKSTFTISERTTFSRADKMRSKEMTPSDWAVHSSFKTTAEVTFSEVIIRYPNCDWFTERLKGISLQKLIDKGVDLTKLINPQKVTLLHCAVREGNLEFCARLMEEGCSPFQTDKKRNTSLHFVAKYGTVPIARLLMEKTPPQMLGAQNVIGRTALHMALVEGNVAVAAFLIESDEGAAINSQDYFRNTPLHWVAESDWYDLARMLLHKGADPYVVNVDMKTPLDIVVQRGHLLTLDVLLEFGVELPPRYVPHISLNKACDCNLIKLAHLLIYVYEIDVNQKEGRFDQTPLHRTALRGHCKATKYLLEWGGNLRAKDSTGATPLHLAAYKGHYEVAIILIENDADLEERDNQNNTALYFAINGGQPKITAALLEMTAHVSVRNSRGETPLHRAAVYGRMEAAFLLIEKYGADIEAMEHFGYVAVSLAASFQRAEMVDYLVQAKAQVCFHDRNGVTILHLAVQRLNFNVSNFRFRDEVDDRSEEERIQSSCDVILSLLNAGIPVDVLDKQSSTPLHIAAQCGNAPEARILVENGAEIDTRDVKGRTALFLAARENKLEVAEYLLLEASADASIKDENGQIALHSASRYADVSMVTLLVTHSDCNSKDDHRATPLHFAAISGNVEVLQYLLYDLPDINTYVYDRKGRTPLHFTIDNGYVDASILLISRAVETDKAYILWFADATGETPLHTATSKNNFEVAEALLKTKSVIPDMRNNEGATCVHLAAWNSSRKFLNLLLKFQFDINVRDNENQTPLDWAWKRNRKFAQYMEKLGATCKIE